MASTDLANSSLKDLLKICRSHALRLPDPLPKDKHFYVDLIRQHREAQRNTVETYAQEDEQESKQEREQDVHVPYQRLEEEEAPPLPRRVSSRRGGDSAEATYARMQEANALAASTAAGKKYAEQIAESVHGRRDSVDDEYVQVSRETLPPASPPRASAPQLQLRPRGPAQIVASLSAAVSSVSATVASVSSTVAPPVAEAASAVAAAAAPLVSAAAAAAAAAVPSANANANAHQAAAVHDAYDDAADAEEFIRSPAVQKITQLLQNMAAFDYIERHTGVPRFYSAALLATLLCIGIFYFIGVLAVCNFVCFVYPAYQTYKTLEGKYLSPAAASVGNKRSSLSADPRQRVRVGSIDDDRSIDLHSYWLTYWCVYGLFRLFEFVADFTLYWLPYYDPLKVLFLVWCFHPSCQGCGFVYRWVIRPLFLPREDAIDRAIARLSASMAQASTEVKQLLLKKVAKRIAGTEDTPRKEAHHHRG